MTHSRDHRGFSELADASAADLVRLLGAQVSGLVRDEVQLARIELQSAARRAGAGAGLIGAAVLLAGYGVGVLLVVVGLLLALVLPGWAAALIVGVVVFALAALLAVIGRARLRQTAPPAESIASVRADIAEVTNAVHRGASPDGASKRLEGQR